MVRKYRNERITLLKGNTGMKVTIAILVGNTGTKVSITLMKGNTGKTISITLMVGKYRKKCNYHTYGREIQGQK